MHASFAAVVVSVVMLSACGSDGGTAKLAFDQGNANALTFAPETFKMKLIAAYLSEDIAPGTGSNAGVTSLFYEHPACAGDLKHCDISAGPAEDGGTIDKIVDTYFDFSPGVDVNAALNAQQNPVEVATYKYVRLEFCKYNAGNAKNVQWGGTFSGNAVSAELTQNSCSVNSAELSPPLSIAAGDTAVVTLSYSLANAVSDVGSGPSCVAAGGSTYCFTPPVFTPAAALR